ncbi:Histone-like DNA-binding protein [Planktothrix rubescens]|nr:Histone-like DNA-binding protein [Planktothrix rubescens]
MLDTTYIEKITGLSGTTVESVIEGLIKFVQLELRAGNEVKIVDFGVFYPKELGERQARNPRTGESIIAKPELNPVSGSLIVLKNLFRILILPQLLQLPRLP